MTAAAEHLGTNTATVSRRIEKITEELGQPLFIKQGQSWQPTPMASRLISIAAQTEAFLSNAEAEELSIAAHNDIRINAPLRILQSYLAPVLGDVAKDLKGVTLIVSMHPASLAYGETDIVLSSKKPDEGRLIRKKLGTTVWRTYCDQKHQHNLEGWADLMGENNETPGQAELKKHFGQPPLLCMQGLNLMRTVMQTSPVACRLPEQYANTHSNLIELDIGFPQTSEIWLSYHYTRRSDLAIKLVVDKISNLKQKVNNKKQHINMPPN
jgi:DNA-binding transcriptional LysR family regulator